MPIDVPPQFRPSLDVLGTLGEVKWRKFTGVLSKAKAAYSPSGMVAPIADALGSTKEDAGKLLTLVLNTYGDAEQLGMAHEAAAREVAGLAPSHAKWNAKERKRLVDRLQDLYDDKYSLGVTAKALSVLLDVDRSYCSSRVLTDARPIFRGVEDPRPSAMAVIHTLRITAHVDDKMTDFYVTLTPRQLDALTADVRRARTKERNLMKAITELPWLQE